MENLHYWLSASCLSFLLSVDDLALCLYPPMDYSGVESNVRRKHTCSIIINQTQKLKV